MRARYLFIGLVAAAATGILASHAVSQEKAPPDQAKMMELWQKHATPGEHHQALGKFVGKWDLASKMHMQPGAPPMESKGTAEFRWLMPNRWLAQEYTSSMMGMPYNGFGITGYDNYKKKYTQVWMDSMNTTMLTAEGVVCDPTGRTTVLWGLMDEYMTGEHDKVVKYVTRWIDDNKFVFEIWDMAIGPEGAAVIEITYTRKQ